MTSILVHDFAGHPFQIQLSRALSDGEFSVVHAFSSDTVTGKGSLHPLPTDSPELQIVSISPRAKFKRYSPIGRIRFELAYARVLIKQIKAVRPDVVITCNTPLFVLWPIVRYFRRTKQPWILWHQDIVSTAVSDEARRKLPGFMARLVERMAVKVEKSAVESAGYVVPIGDFFVEQYRAWGVVDALFEVIPNWAPLDEIYPTDKSSAWSDSLGLDANRFRLVYSGTLGRKHNPLLLLDIVDKCKELGLAAELLVISEGEGVAQLMAASAGRDDIVVHGYQPMEDLRFVLGSGDVLIGLLEPDASTFSVPSKVLSYLAAGRPTALLAPNSNPAVTTVEASGGFVSTPDGAGVAAVAQWIVELSEDAGLKSRLSRQARQFAEENFSIAKVTLQFEAIVQKVLNR